MKNDWVKIEDKIYFSKFASAIGFSESELYCKAIWTGTVQRHITGDIARYVQ